MMKLRLYSNCRLTKEYNEVIQHEYLEGYLATLTSTLYEIDDVYLTRKGQFTLDILNLGIFQYNYFKLEDTTNNITRYFFIDEAEIVNGSCIIEYSEDIWSSYGHLINIIKGNVENLRYGIGSNIKLLPVEYASNDALQIVSPYQYDTTDKVVLIVNVSFYNFVAQGSDEPSYRFYKTFYCVADYPQVMPQQTLKRMLSILKGLISSSSGLDGFQWQPQAQTFINFDAYEVVNAYILPVNIYRDIGIYQAIQSAIDNDVYSTINCYVDDIVLGTKVPIRLFEIPENIYSKTYTLSNDYKNFGIGMLDNIIPIKSNGSSISYSIRAYISEMFNEFMLQVDTSIIDITSSFNIEMPLSVQSADITQQQAIARNVKNQVLAYDKQQIELRRWTGMTNNLVKAGASGFNVGSGDVGSLTSLVGSITGSLEGAQDYMINLKKNELDKWQTNLEMYKTNTAITLSNDKLYSLYYGLVILKVLPDNETYVNDVIEVVGFNTNMVVADSSLLTTAQENKDYNIIKFSNVMLYGNLPHSIQLLLSEILTKGIKIYFTSSI